MGYHRQLPPVPPAVTASQQALSSLSDAQGSGCAFFSLSSPASDSESCGGICRASQASICSRSFCVGTGVRGSVGACSLLFEPLGEFVISLGYKCSLPGCGFLQALWCSGRFNSPVCGSLVFLVVPPVLVCNGHLVGRSRDGVSGAGLLALPLCVNSGEAPQRS